MNTLNTQHANTAKPNGLTVEDFLDANRNIETFRKVRETYPRARELCEFCDATDTQRLVWALLCDFDEPSVQQGKILYEMIGERLEWDASETGQAARAYLCDPNAATWNTVTATQYALAFLKSRGAPEGEFDLYALNEIGNGRRFADTTRGRFLFCYTANRWRIYNARRGVWEYDDAALVEEAAKAVEAQICDEARDERDDDRRAKLYKHAATITKRKTRETMLKDAASERGMNAAPGAFDAQLHLFNCANGTLDLRTGELRPHEPRDLLTKSAGIAFDPNATAPTWTRALETWMPDAETRDYLQECAGLSLSGEVRDEFFNFLFGGGDNGKSTFLSTLERVSGDYFRHAKAEIFMRPKFARDGEASTPGLLSLQGARLLTVSEIEGEHEMSAALVKGLTGRDPITARGNYDKRPTTFRPQFTLWMFGNEKPQIADASDGMWRRVRLIEFNQVIPKADRDPDFAEKLEAELSGVLNWALDGLKRVQQRGLIVPEAVSVSTASYRAEQDTMSGFISEMCEQSPTAFVVSGELWAAWKSYCSEADEAGTQNQFAAELRRHNIADARQRVNGRVTRVWKGLRLKSLPGE